jgi:two-component system response regulator HydG
MFTSFSEFKFFQSFRIPVESSDDVRFMVEFEDDMGKFRYIEDAKLEDASVTGLGFVTTKKMSVMNNIRISISFKRLRIDLEGHIVRSFGSHESEEHMLYGIELDEDDQPNMKRFIQQYVASFSPDRARDCIANMALSERYKQATEGFEVFSLMLSLFKDITAFGSQESFLKSMLEEITRIINAQRASIFLINPQTNELEAVAALGIEKELLKFDYRKGIAGSVFTTGVSLNIDTKTDMVRFSEKIDDLTGFETKSILCHPITNREDKVIGVIEILNKRNEDRFTVEDEKTMKVLSVIFSSVFHNYNPISEKSLIRRFSTPYDREYAFIGRSPGTNEIRKAIVRLKDIDSPLYVNGEIGVGKKLIAQIVHNEGRRGLNGFEIIQCKGLDDEDLHNQIFGSEKITSVLETCQGGTVCFNEISFMTLSMQYKLVEILKAKRIPGSDIAIDVRFIFTSSEDLEELTIKKGEFNSELYEYISASVCNIEPLRKRNQDIEDLLSHFLRRECKKQGLLLKEFSDEVKEQLVNFDWPGNVSELQKAVEKAVLYNPKAHVISKLTNGATPIIDLSQSSIQGLDNIPYARDYKLPLKDRMNLVEREMILSEIRRNKGNKSKAAKEMGISREALRKKLLISDKILETLSGEKSSLVDKDEAA